MLTGYHTVEDRNNPDVILLEGPFRCEREDAWLGHGYYFWDTRIELAHFWGELNFNRRGHVICRGIINDDPGILWDLDGRIAHQEEFIAAIDMMIDAGIISRDEDATVNEIITFLKKRDILTYKAIRAADEDNDTYFIRFKPRKAPKQAKMRLRQRVQICLIEKNNLTLQEFLIIFPEKYTY
ncbi:MAG: hypothetical protein IT262_03125 [Saprospiraceae bacterium]|nr:hypothetical protein [Saprospiraceae bacterium]